MQEYRAAISVAYGCWIADQCREFGISMLDSRPWNSVIERAINLLY